MCEYNKQAEDFLKSTNTKFSYKFLKNGVYFLEDKETNTARDIYLITLTRGIKKRQFKFGDSISNSGSGKGIKPYDFLACVTKNEDVINFKEFCSSYGYNVDSIKALRLWKLCRSEFYKITSLYNQKELEKLQEIQ